MGADTKYHLDQMQRVDLRTVWPYEALDFTRWLSEEATSTCLDLQLASSSNSSIRSMDASASSSMCPMTRRLTSGKSTRVCVLILPESKLPK